MLMKCLVVIMIIIFTLYECKHNNYYFENNKNNWIQYMKNVRNKS